MITPASLEEHRKALLGHCYRMLGSIADADDAVQETMLRSLRGLPGFEERSQLRTWLYRIATNVCLDALAARARRERPIDLGPAGSINDELTQRDRVHWLEPLPEERVLPEIDDPERRLIQLESIRLAYVAALQYIPPKQRAVLLLTEVVGWSAVEVAERLEMSVASVNSALQRARATLAKADIAPRQEELSDVQRSLVTRFVDAFERFDVEAITGLLHDDIAFSMPPFSLWLRGPDSVRGWLLGRGSGCKGSLLVPTKANGLPAFGQYRPSEDGQSFKPWALTVLELSVDRITGWTSFLDTEVLFPKFDLPPELLPKA